MLAVSDNGGWCWFQGERAVVAGGALYVASVANGAGVGGAARHGNIEVTRVDLGTGERRVWVLHERLEGDDHDSPGLYVRGDGRLVAVYGQHGDGLRPGDALQRWRVQRADGEWEAEQTLDVGANYTYANLLYVPAERLLYNFHRGFGFNPNYCVSADEGLTWRYGGRALAWTADAEGRKLPGAGRPYARYASNGSDEVHVTVTEDHPRNYDNSIYHGVFRAGHVLRSDGTVVGKLSTSHECSVRPTDLTLVFRGDADHVAWTTDVRVDGAGVPHALFTVQRGDGDKRHLPHEGGADLRFMYARWDAAGRAWRVAEAAHAGSRLYAPEVDYTGLGALHPYDARLMYISTNAHPVTGAPLLARSGRRCYQIYKGQSEDEGRTWHWTRLTFTEDADNVRPVVAAGDARRPVLVWLTGELRTFTDYTLRVVALPL